MSRKRRDDFAAEDARHLLRQREQDVFLKKLPVQEQCCRMARSENRNKLSKSSNYGDIHLFSHFPPNVEGGGKGQLTIFPF